MISYDGVGTIIRYTGEVYLGFLQDGLVKDFPQLRGTKTRQGKLLFGQDNAGPRRDFRVKKFQTKNRITILNWLSYSSDLSPIENACGFIKEELFKKSSQLKAADGTWEEI